jgi:hypothetical protein
MATLRGPGTAASTRRPGAAGAINEAWAVINEGMGSVARPGYGDFFEEEAPSGIKRLCHNVQPFGRGRHGQPINIRWHGVR